MRSFLRSVMAQPARRRTLFVLAAAAAFASIVPASAAEKLKLAQNQSPISGVSIVADRKGFFARNGLEVEVINFTTGKQCLDTVMGGAADIATTAEAPTTAAAMSGQKIAFLARTEYSYIKTLTATSAGIGKLSDLKGKRIAFTAGTGGEVYTMQLLKKAGLGKDDVTLVNLRPQDMVAALASGSIDAYDTWEPHIYNGTKALGAKAAPLDTKGIYAETFNIVVMQDYLQKKPAVVTSFLKSLVEAEAWMKANPDEAIKVVAEFVKMPVDDLKPIWDDYVYQVALDEPDARRPQCACRLAPGLRQSPARRGDAGLAQGHLSRAAEIGRAGEGENPGMRPWRRCASNPTPGRRFRDGSRPSRCGSRSRCFCWPGRQPRPRAM